MVLSIQCIGKDKLQEQETKNNWQGLDIREFDDKGQHETTLEGFRTVVHSNFSGGFTISSGRNRQTLLHTSIIQAFMR